ncbi:kynureninase [Punctularia strigosozonata HHB-11173 SS5]|uniref:kynureninase n=1 Tax=Punctularia strigosozonata (strain HHB-11173) TaxID=741275 RepID=UPI0004417781|nr:kynureninase [Punctularia strigosozonata HHB-11173 SS5]EIN07460.1 kynureninase [Punctularia strigosozonata HHB-11173 SS5]
MAVPSQPTRRLSLPARDEFRIPTNKDIGATSLAREVAHDTCVYMCGNSLGALPKRSEELVKEEFAVWGTRAVEGHFDHPHGREWMNIADTVHPFLADLVGADASEVACMGTLTANLHLMMNTFYKPTADRYKILCEAHAFPSDQYAFASQAALHGLDPADAVLQLYPRAGEFTLREADILDVLEREGDRIALVLFSGVQYYTGQWFPMESVTKKGREKGCIVGWDLAHAIGNVPMSLHDWGADFAVWCSYKYLNSGPGGIAGIYMHSRWNDKVTNFAGWWGHEPSTRFQMPPVFSPIAGAQGFQQSNPSVLATVSLLGSLQVFHDAGGISVLRERSVRLTKLLEDGLKSSKYFVPPEEAAARYPALVPSSSASSATPPLSEPASARPSFTIITPSDPSSRGAQLSLLFLPPASGVMQKVHDGLKARGVIGDERRPDVIRLAPTPLYNTEDEVRRTVEVLEQTLQGIA